MCIKNLSAVVLTAVILISNLSFSNAATAAEAAKTYPDVAPSHWAADSISDMSEKKIVTGYEDGTFQPVQTLTFGEFIKMMVVAENGQELPLGQTPDHWAINYFKNGLELKLYSENDIDKSMLDREIPRKYMALILSNALGDENVDNYSQIEATVKDVDSNVKYDYHIIKAYAEGILSGYTDGSFKPDGTLNRAEATVVLQRFLDPEKRTPVTAENPTNAAQIVEGSVANRGDGFKEWIDNSPSTKPIGEAISNYKQVFSTMDLKYYEIVTDYPEKMDIVLGKFGETEFICMPLGDGSRGAVLIKDGRCIDDMTDYGSGKLSNTSYYSWNTDVHGDKLPDFDYIGFCKSTGDTIILVANPFKNGYTIAEKL